MVVVIMQDVNDHLEDALISSDVPQSIIKCWTPSLNTHININSNILMLSGSPTYLIGSDFQVSRGTWQVLTTSPSIQSWPNHHDHDTDHNQAHDVRPPAVFHPSLTPELAVALAGSPFILVFHPRIHPCFHSRIHHIHQLYHRIYNHQLSICVSAALLKIKFQW